MFEVVDLVLWREEDGDDCVPMSSLNKLQVKAKLEKAADFSHFHESSSGEVSPPLVWESGCYFLTTKKKSTV